MTTKRFTIPAFNPEKFLVRERKKAAANRKLAQGRLFPIRFSRERRLDFIARLAAETPGAIYLGEDLARAHASLLTLQAGIARELVAIGLGHDDRLVEMLIVDVVCDPAWRRAVRRRRG